MSDRRHRSELAGTEAELAEARGELRRAQAASAATLSRATRLAQLVSSLVPLTDPQEILERAASEVAEQFGADIAAFLLRPEGSADGPLSLAAHWGIPDRNLPAFIEEPPAIVNSLDPIQPLAGPVEELGLPAWLRDSRPRHLVWVKLVLRGEPGGFMALAGLSNEPFKPSDVRELGLVLSRIMLAVDNGRLYSHTQEQVHRLQRLHEVAATLAGTLDVERIVDSLATT